MALTGFNPTEVRTSINGVKSAYSDLIEQLGNQMQTQFVDGMADKWACKDAQTFFKDAFKPTIDDLIKNVNTVFQSVVDAMNSAADRWASDTGTTYTKVQFTPVTKAMNISGIKENINGVRGVDVNQANTVAGKLSTISAQATSALSRAKAAVQTCGFIGGKQASSLSNSLENIKTKISSSTEEITNAAKTGINNTVSTYNTSATEIANAFNGN